MNEVGEHLHNRRTKKRAIRKLSWVVLIAVVLLIPGAGIFTMNLAPFQAFGGALWLKNGPHYISDTQIKSRMEQLTAPKEAALVNQISKSTPSCDTLDDGFCQKSPGEYVYKSLV